MGSPRSLPSVSAWASSFFIRPSPERTAILRKSLMYFDFEDYHPDITPVGRAISWREGVLLSIIWHLIMVILVLTAPRWLPDHSAEARAKAVALAEQRVDRDRGRFVFVAPKNDVKAPRPPARAELSDQDRVLR